MTNDDVLAKIRSRGHWDVAVHPGRRLDTPLPMRDLLRVLETNAVRFRGWPVPYIDHREQIRRGNDWIGQEIDAEIVDHYEAWRFFRSAQFTQLRAVSADWRGGRDRTPVPVGAVAVIEVWEILFYMTELIELAARLALATSAESFAVDASLIGMQDRALVAGMPARELHGLYVFSEDTIRVEEVIPSPRLAGEPARVAVEISNAILTRFGLDLEPGVLEDYQRELLRYRQRS